MEKKAVLNEVFQGELYYRHVPVRFLCFIWTLKLSDALNMSALHFVIKIYRRIQL